MQNESLLIRNAQKGEEDAFVALYHKYRERIYRYFFSRVGDQSDAEELTSQTFLAVLEKLPGYHHKGKFTAWLFSIARNKVMDYFREQSKTRNSSNQDYIAVMYDPHIIENLVAKQRAEELANLIRLLPPDRKEVLRLRFVVGLTYREIAEILGRKTAAVKKTVYRLLGEMKQSLESYDD